ncbi:MAG: tRNA ((7)-)-methyltransferase [Actinomycetota bacterium]
MVAVEPPRPPARSFQPRRRGLPAARAAAFERDAPRWCLDVFGDPLDLDDVFGAGARVVLDIGFGGGEGLIDLAAARPDECIIGVEVHTPGTANVVDAVERHAWRHVRLVAGDVLDFLPRLETGSLAGVRVWFPDPWAKRKQQHRRIVRPDVVAKLVDRLALGGTVHVATDIADYARQAAAVLDAERRLRGGVVPRPSWRPVTRFERRGLAEGRTPSDLLYERIE